MLLLLRHLAEVPPNVMAVQVQVNLLKLTLILMFTVYIEDVADVDHLSAFLSWRSL